MPIPPRGGDTTISAPACSIAVCAGDRAGGIGPQIGKLIERAAGPLVVDLLWHLPTGIVDRRAAPARRITALDRPRSSPARSGSSGTEPGFGRRPYRVLLRRRHGHADAGLFQRAKATTCSACCRSAPSASSAAGSSITAACRRSPIPTTSSPADEAATAQADRAGLPADRRADAAHLARAVAAALERAPGTAGMARPALRDRRRWPAWREAIGAAHAPQSAEDLTPATPARERLAYDEILPASWRWPWCGPAGGAAPAGRWPATGALQAAADAPASASR